MNDQPALLALYELESHVLPHLETINQVDPTVQHCLEEARTLLHRAQDFLQGAIESYALQLPDQDEVGNSPDTPSSDLSDEDSYYPATPPRH